MPFIAVAIFSMPMFARIVRSNTLALKNGVYIEAAEKCSGASDARILFKHLLPGSFSNIIVYYTMTIGNSILTASSLSFSGWAQSRQVRSGERCSAVESYIGLSWHLTFFPGLAIFHTVLAFNMLGDGLRDALDLSLKVKGR